MDLSRVLDVAPLVQAFWISLVIGFVSMFPILNLLKRVKSRQTISQYVPEHQAKQGTPTMGGLITLGGIVVSLGYCLLTANQPAMSGAKVYLIVILAFAVIGFVDDFLMPRMVKGSRGLGWKQKILLEIVFAAGPIALFEHAHWQSTLIAVFVVLFFANAYNFTDGLDGLAGSVGIVLVAGLAGLSFMARGEEALVVAVVGAAIIGGLIPFLFLNLPPAKLFMGDVGALPIGAAIGLMVWQLGFNQPSEFPTWLALAAMSLVMVAGLLPVPIQIASVKLRHGKRVFRKTPIHHAFQDMGIAETRIVGSYLLSQVLLSAFGISVVLWLNRLTDFHWAMTVK